MLLKIRTSVDRNSDSTLLSLRSEEIVEILFQILYRCQEDIFTIKKAGMRTLWGSFSNGKEPHILSQINFSKLFLNLAPLTFLLLLKLKIPQLSCYHP